MEEENYSQPEENSSGVNLDSEDQSDTDGGPGQVFDISADLNISPVTERVDPPSLNPVFSAPIKRKSPVPIPAKQLDESQYIPQQSKSSASSLSRGDTITPQTPRPPISVVSPKPPVSVIPPQAPAIPATAKPTPRVEAAPEVSRPPRTIPLQNFSDILQKARGQVPTTQPGELPDLVPSKPASAPAPRPPISSIVPPAAQPVPIPATPTPEISTQATAPIAAPITPTATPITPTGPHTVVVDVPVVSPNAPAPEIKESPFKKLLPTENNVKQLRTYEGDVADLIASKQTSRATIAIAESSKDEEVQTISTKEERPPRHIGIKILSVLLSLIMIGGGGVIGYYFYSISPLAVHTEKLPPSTNTSTSLIPADSHVTVSLDATLLQQAPAKIRAEIAKPLPANTIKEIVLMHTDNGAFKKMSASETLAFFDIHPPDILVRSLTTEWMFGVYADATGQKSIFVVSANNFFQNTFAGMLQWENVMADDLKQYLYATAPGGIANIPNLPLVIPNTPAVIVTTPAMTATTSASTTKTTTKTTTKPPATKKTTSTKTATTTITATSTAGVSTNTQTSTPAYFTVRGRFVDRIVKNKDVREFITADSKILFLYSFIDNSRLVFASDEKVLGEILSRLEKQAFVR